MRRKLLTLCLLQLFPMSAAAVAAAAGKQAVLVTGGSQGIGAEIVRSLASRSEYRVYLGCRDVAKGKHAVHDLAADEASRVEVVQLDVTKQEQIDAAAAHILAACGTLFALVNNAGVGLDLPFTKAATKTDPLLARTTLDINYSGAVAVCEAFLPHMSRGGRIVNISSGAGPQNLEKMDAKMRDEFMREGSPGMCLAQSCIAPALLTGVLRLTWWTCCCTADLTEEEVHAHVQKFIEIYEREAQSSDATLPKMSAEGYWLQAYGFSKAAMNAWTRALARGRGKDLLVNACSPGFVRTAMTADYDSSVTLR